jgi:hypothetical protein
VRDSYFHHACVYTSGGFGYLLSLHAYSSNSLIENNIFCYANENIFLENTGAGNVIAYNYLDGSWVNEGDGTHQMADYGTHAGYPYMDLFEGNMATKWETGGIHGEAEYLFHFRNYIDRNHKYNCESTHPYNDTGLVGCFEHGSTAWHMTYIGNVCGELGQGTTYEIDGYNDGTPAMFRWRSSNYAAIKAEALRVYNYFFTTGTVYDYPGDTIKNSYYLTNKPSWWDDQSAPGYCRPWPPIGPDVSGYVVDIPAKDRFEGETYNATPCPGPGPPSYPLNLHKE